MDINELRRHIHQVIFSTCINIAKADDDAQDMHKTLDWYPGQNDRFVVTFMEENKISSQKFAAIEPAITFYMQQFPR